MSMNLGFMLIALALLPVTDAAAVSMKGKLSIEPSLPVQAAVDAHKAGSVDQFGHDSDSSYSARVAMDMITMGIAGGLFVCIMGTAFAIWFMQRQAEQTDEEADAELGASESKAGDYAEIVKVLARKVAQDAGPKISKGAAIKHVLESRMSNFTAKAKTFLMDEMTGTAGEVLKECDAEEAMLLLNWNAAVEANFPPMSILLAGVVSPTVLSLMSAHHWVQLLFVALPMFGACVAAIIIDWGAPCSIPTLYAWLWTQTTLAFLMLIGHAALLVKILIGKSRLSAKSDETHAKMEKSPDGSIANMRAQVVGNMAVLQEALIIENGIRHSLWNIVVGVSTLAWVITTVWCLVLVVGWTFVPGQVAFHPKAAAVAKTDFCGAWMTVLVLKISMLLSVLFLFLNMATVIQFFCDMMIGSQGFSEAVLGKARELDSKGVGLPAVELLTRAFLLRGGSDTLDSKLATVQYKKARMEKEKADLEAKVKQVRSQLDIAIARESSVLGQVKSKASAEPEFDLDKWKAAGEDTVVLKSAADKISQDTTKKFDELMQSIQESETMAAMKEMSQKAIAQAQEAYEKLPRYDELSDMAAQATQQAQNLAQQAIDAANDPELANKLKALQEQASKAMEDAQAMAQEMAEAVNDPEKQKMLQAKAEEAFAKAKEAASSAAEAIQDPELQKKLMEASQNALGAVQESAEYAVAVAQEEGQKRLEQAKEALANLPKFDELSDMAAQATQQAQNLAQQAIDAANDPELANKLKALQEQASKAMEDAQAMAQEVAEAANDPEKQKQLQAKAEEAFAKAKAASSSAAAAIQDPNLQKQLQEASQNALDSVKATAEYAVEVAQEEGRQKA